MLTINESSLTLIASIFIAYKLLRYLEQWSDARADRNARKETHGL